MSGSDPVRLADRIIDREKIRHQLGIHAMSIYTAMRGEHGCTIAGARVELIMEDGSRALVTAQEHSNGLIRIQAGTEGTP